MKELSNAACIVGVDESDEIGTLPGKSQLTLHVEAIHNAVRDAGLRVSDIDGVFTACMHLGRGTSRRRFYMFRVFGADPGLGTTWTNGAVYALPRAGFRREWGNEWLRGAEVTPVLRVLVGPDDFPLRHVVVRG